MSGLPNSSYRYVLTNLKTAPFFFPVFRLGFFSFIRI